MNRTITSVLGNQQRLDGGAMFGNAPRAVWERWIPPDERHRIPLACRAMLVREPDGRRVLVETGIGAFFEPKLRDRYGIVEDRHVLLDSLAALGLTDADINLVVLSHLHFDHAGGLLSAWSENGKPELLFPNARFLVGATAWDRARHPHARDRASFVPELVALLEASGRLEVVTGGRCPLLPDWRFHESHGHTPGLLLPEVPLRDGPVVFAADLIPGTPWVHLPITMGYDRYPELLIDEMERLLSDLVGRNGRLFYTHDPSTALSGLRFADGRYTAVDRVAEPRDLA
ncbi:MAG: MBL fold metallo-hydrolase [Deltaproteobacteria bacterium]|nr:MBL fold metallo-hydrolase [Deltaproteobacteria bacterium]